MALLVLLSAALLLTARADILLDQNATSDTLGTRNLPQARMWQSFTPHSSGTLLTLDVLLGVTSATCEPLSAVLLIVDGLPSSFDDLNAWAELSDATPTTPPALLHRQAVTTTCAAATCTARECLGWESLGLSAAVTVTANRVVSFALLHVQPASAGSATHARIGVVPVIAGSTGRSSLLVSPVFHTRFGQYAFRAFLDDDVSGSTQAGASSNKGATGGSSSSAGTASYAVAIGVIGAVAIVALVSLLVVRARRSGAQAVADSTAPMTADQLRHASPRDAWDYLHRTRASGPTPTVSPRKITVSETAMDAPRSSMRFYDEGESDTDELRPSTPSHRGRVSPLSTGSSHTLAWQPATGFGPVQRISVSAAPAESPVSSTLASALASPVSDKDKKRRRLPATPTSPDTSAASARASTSSSDPVLVSPVRTPKATATAAWGEDSSAPASAPASASVASAPASHKKQRPAPVAEEDVDVDFLPPFVINQGYQC